MIYFANELIGHGLIQDGLYYLDKDDNKISSDKVVKIHTISNEFIGENYLYHLRLCHILSNRVNKLGSMGILGNLDSDLCPTCVSCVEGKMTKKPFTGHFERATNILELIYCDVCELNVQSKGG